MNRRMKSSKALLWVALFVGCNIVEVEEGNSPDSNNSPSGTEDQVNLGDQVLPEDALSLGQLLHNNDSKTWMASQFTIEGVGAFLDCRLDDTITLFSDGTYSYDGGANLCGADDDQRNRTGNWTFSFETLALIFEPGTDEEASATIVTLDEGVFTFTGVYQSNLFGSFDIEGRYTSASN